MTAPSDWAARAVDLYSASELASEIQQASSRWDELVSEGIERILTDHETQADDDFVREVGCVNLAQNTGMRTVVADHPVSISVRRYKDEPARIELETANTTDLDDLHWWTADEARAIAQRLLQAADLIERKVR